MLLCQLIKDIKLALNPLYNANEINSFIKILANYYLNISPVQLHFSEKHFILPEIANEINKAIERLKQQEPIQYIIGETDFFDFTFKVTPEVLIPRPETEELVNWIISDYKNCKELILLDIGTGSGCIAITLDKKLSDVKTFAIDVSEKAIQIAQTNAKTNNSSVTFLQKDIFKVERKTFSHKFDIIVSNPPYVTESDKKEMQKNVLDFEPEIALFVSDNKPLIFYNTIITFATSNLKIGGEIYLEINEKFANNIKDILKKSKFVNIKIKQDLNNKDRMIKAQYNG